MSELNMVSLPEVAETAAADGWRQLLELNLGRRVTAEFLAGTKEMVIKTGTLYAVQQDYFLLTDDYGNYVAADLYGLKFVTFCPDCVPVDGGVESTEALQDEPRVMEGEKTQQQNTQNKDSTADITGMDASRTRATSPISLAALNYAKRKARRLD